MSGARLPQCRGIYLPSLTISDFSYRIGIGGVGIFFEGDIWLVFGSEDRGIILAETPVRAELPGQPGLGFGAFDAVFEIELFDEDGNLDPIGAELLPVDGEVIQVGVMTEEPSIFSLGCFQFCNNLGEDGGCTDNVQVECTEGALPVPTF